MIQKIEIENLATFTEKTLFEPKKINFLYGSNGSGKTTISNLLGGYALNSESVVTNPKDLKVLVYNRTFVKDNFKKSSIKGIFTLGKESIEEQEKHDVLTKEIDLCNQEIFRVEEVMSKNLKEEIELEDKLYERLWKFQRELNETIPETLAGFRGSKKTLGDQVYKKFIEKKYNLEIDFKALKELYEIAYSKIVEQEAEIKLMWIKNFNTLENSSLLSKNIMGSSKTTVGNLISLMNNSDWVKEGFEYLDTESKVCPFCQQNVEDLRLKEILDYFDEEYKRDIKKLEQFCSNYEKAFREVISKLKEIISNNKTVQSNEEFVLKVKNLEIILESNLSLIKQKLKS